MTDHSERVRASLAGRYTIERELGRGGMATVYLARDTKHDRLVAVKVLRPELAAVLGGERFLREIRVTAQLQHPHILTLIDSGEINGFLYYVMPYVEGESLRRHLEREGQLPLDEALRITRAIASALDFAHGRGVIHRDIKPENVMLHEGEPMVADFGIALAVSTAGRERLTETGLSLGTPAYMSPEQASADPKLDGRSDQYSLACVLYEMLAGEPPYTGPTAQAIIAKRLTEPIPHLGAVRRVPPALEAGVTKALAKAPADRYGSAGAFVAALTSGSNGTTYPGWRTPGVAVAALLIIAGAAAWFWSSRNGSVRPVATVVPFTSSAGQKFEPVFSPDGNEIAYAWTGENNDNGDIYVKLIDAGGPLRLTSSLADEYCPTWSPDGRYVAFIRDGPAGTAAYYVVPALGGAERKIAERNGPWHFGRCMDWSPDGKSLVAADRMTPEDSRYSILLLAIEDGQRKAIVSQPDQFVSAPTLSPDGRTVAYVQGAGFLTGDIYVVPVSGGRPRRVTSDGRFLLGLAWTPDGKGIVFSSNRGGLFRLWRIGVSGGMPEPVNGVGDGAVAPTISTRGDRLAYIERRVDANVWRMAGPSWKGRPPAATRIVASSRADYEGSFSPDGKRIAFTSDRTGSFEMWASNSDGTNQIQLTSLKAADAGSPRWSPDGRTIAFDARLEGHGGIFTIDAAGGAPSRITNDSLDNNLPTWSRDGNWIYFSSSRTGSWQIWKVPSSGGAAAQVTRNGGFIAQESLDGKSLYVWVGGSEGGAIWKMPVAGGETVPVIQGVRYWAWWSVARNGIYYVDGSTPSTNLRFSDFASQRTRSITAIDFGYSYWIPGAQYFDLSSDGRWILFDRGEQVDSDIMLVENFH
jgi:eukaryotic-like serine/threonine-protein kinase